jgi:hypothetical protein
MFLAVSYLTDLGRANVFAAEKSGFVRFDKHRLPR